ncbi:MAG: 3-oxoacyl-ACP synthase [Bacteroidia bacterium]
MSLKQDVIDTCRDLLKSRQLELQKDEESARESAASETKSSAGDKHETSRELIHRDREIITQSLNELSKQLLELDKAQDAASSDLIRLGSIVKTSLGYFFLGPSLGFVNSNDLKVACVSVSAPIALVILGKSAGESVNFRGNILKIESVA